MFDTQVYNLDSTKELIRNANYSFSNYEKCQVENYIHILEKVTCRVSKNY